MTPKPKPRTATGAPRRKAPRAVATRNTLSGRPRAQQITADRRKALIVGIDFYANTETLPVLHGCVNDARAVSKVMTCNGDGTVNFGSVTVKTASSAGEAITRADLKDSVRELFASDGEIALLYFAGHGHVEETGGYLCGSEARRGDDGLALAEVLTLALASPAENRIIILDSCHSGVAGNPGGHSIAELSEGITILTASTVDQYAQEQDGGGVFTALLLDALNGAAANLVGEVTPGSVYAHVDQSLGPWKQRPVFKTNVKKFVSLRRAAPLIAVEDLRMLPEFFPRRDALFALDPTFEGEFLGRHPDLPPPNPVNVARFRVLQRYVGLNLVTPVGASKPHMWHAAIESKACRLTVLGEHYRELVASNLI
jgi:hypothetical protein